MINKVKFFDIPVKNDFKKYGNIHRTNGCLLDYPYFKKYFTLIAID